jgi:hypothetical protein
MAAYATRLHSLQSGFCCNCGAPMQLSAAPGVPNFSLPVCSEKCLDAWKTKETKSICGTV